MKQSYSTNWWPLEEKTNDTLSRLPSKVAFGLVEAVAGRKCPPSSPR